MECLKANQALVSKALCLTAFVIVLQAFSMAGHAAVPPPSACQTGWQNSLVSPADLKRSLPKGALKHERQIGQSASAVNQSKRKVFRRSRGGSGGGLEPEMAAAAGAFIAGALLF